MAIYNDKNIRDKVAKLLKKGNSLKSIADELGLGITTITKIKHTLAVDDLAIDTTVVSDEVEMEQDYENGKVGLFILSPRIKTPEQAMKKAGLSPDDWEITKCLVKTWELGAKVEGTNHHGHKFTRGIAVEPLYGLTIHCKRRRGYSPDIFLERLRKALRGSQKVPPKKRYNLKNNRHQVMLSIPDIHFGKLAWAATSGEDYTLETARDRYLEAVAFLAHETSIWNPSQINYVIGNDALHVDNGRSTTTKGTYVESDCKWQDAYIQLATTLKDSINLLKEYAPVNVIVVPGNHDEEKMFTMGHAVGWLFEDDPNVNVDWSPVHRKYATLGNTMIMFEHGHNMQREKKGVGHLMASEQPEMWANSIYREVVTGHWHHKKDILVESMQVDTIKDVTIRFLPSLAGTDEWHHKHGYINIKAAEAHVYDMESGHRAFVEYRL